jgi:TRAP-type C4-dicarboxylate transport system permease small subunit
MLNKIGTCMSYLGMSAVVFLALLTGMDVVGRYLFNSPLQGTFELTEIVMCLVVAFGIAFTTAKDEHIMVDALFEKLPSSAQRKLTVVANTCGVLVFGILCWKGVETGIESIRDKEATELLNVPVFPFKFILVLGFFLSLLFVIVRIVQLMNRKQN